MKNFHNIFFYIATFCIALIIGNSEFLPLVDLPQFAGQLQIIKSIILQNTDSIWYQDIEINFFLPYWMAYILALPISFILPIQYAVNLTVALIFILFIYSSSTLREFIKAPKYLDWMLLPAFFGMPYIFGFISYLMGVSLSILLLKNYLIYLTYPQKKYFLYTIFLGILVYLSHFFVFLFIGLTLGLTCILSMKNWKIKPIIYKVLPLIFFACLLPIFFLNQHFFQSNDVTALINESQYDIVTHSFYIKLYNLFTYLWAYHIESQVSETYYIVISIFILILPFLIGYTPSKTVWKYAPITVFLCCWFLLPEYIAKTFAIYTRLIIFFIPFYILIFESNPSPKKYKPIFQYVLLPFYGILILFLTMQPIYDIYLFNKHNTFIATINKLENKKRILHLQFSPYTAKSESFRTIRAYLHFPVWYQAIKNGWVDYNFAWYPTQLVRYKSAKSTSEIMPNQLNSMQQLNRIKNCNIYDYLVVRITTYAEKEQFHTILPSSTCSHNLLFNEGAWYIYAKQPK